MTPNGPGPPSPAVPSPAGGRGPGIARSSPHFRKGRLFVTLKP